MKLISSLRSTTNIGRVWLFLLGLATLSIVGTWVWYRSVPRQNIVLVTFDTTRADRLGLYGYSRGLTEAFDDFGRRGVVFERAYAPAPITLPSHATMLTGLYPPEHGLRVNGAGKLAQDIPFLPAILKEQGYDTAAFIAAPVLDSIYGLDRGFDVYDDDCSRSAGSHGEPRRDGKVIVDAALRWLEQRTDKPFFCWIHLYDAHGPYDPRVDAYQQRFEENPYDAGVAWEVEQFGRVTDYLRDHDLQSRTLVVVAGDHGEGLGDHLEDEHGMLVYNTTLHVPLAFVGPEQFCRPGTRVPQPVSLVDLMPTLLEVLRLPAPQHLSGTSLLAALEGRPIAARDCYAEAETPFVMNRWAPLQTVISGRWKYIQSTRPELYDLEHDPGELTDLAGTTSEQCDRLRLRLQDLQETFQITSADRVTLSERDLGDLHALGYVGGANGDAVGAARRGEQLPDVKDFLPFLAQFERAKHLAHESKSRRSAAKMAETIALLREVVQATQDFPMADAFLGDCLAQSGQPIEAEQTYRALLSRHPDFGKVRFHLGKVLSELGRFEEAAAEFRRLLEDDPESATAQFELAQALTQLSKYDEAIEAYRDALRIAPGYTAASLELGRLFVQLRQPKAAELCFEAALAQNPGSADVRAHLMMVLVQTGRIEQAIQRGKELVELDPASFDARFNLGILLNSQGRFAEGLAQLREAQRLRPDDPRPARQIEQADEAMKKVKKSPR